MWKTKEDFITAVKADRRCRQWTTLAVAISIAGYINGEKQYAWPSVGRLASDNGTDRRSVRRAISQLVAAGLLVVKHGGGKTTNHYRLKRGAITPPREGRLPLSAGGNYPSNTKNETLNEKTTIRRRRSKIDFSDLRPQSRNGEAAPQSTGTERTLPPNGKRHQRRSRVAYFPADWELGPSEAATAQTIAQWAEDRARREFKRFRKWHTDRDNRSADWSENWTTWCENGCGYDGERAGRLPKDQLAANGAMSWYQNQQAAYESMDMEETGYGNATADSEE